MGQTLKVLAALIFVAALGWVLLQPVFDAVEIDAVEPDDEVTATPLESPEPIPSEEPSPEPSPDEEEPAALPEEFRTRPLFDRYPARCLAAHSGPSSTDAFILMPPEAGSGALSEQQRVMRAPLQGAPPTISESEHGSPLQVSIAGDAAAGLHPPELPFERALGGGPEPSFTSLGLRGRFKVWTWSPISDCGVAVRKDGTALVFGRPGNKPILARGHVRQIAFSPDGRKLALVLHEEEIASVWVADLGGSRMREVDRDWVSAGLELRAWSPDAKLLYVTRGDDGLGLSFVTASVPSQQGRLITGTPVTSLEQCSGRLLAVVDGAIVEITKRGADRLTQPRPGYGAVSCSPEGRFLATIRAGELVLLDATGDEMPDLTPDTGYRDVYVDWGVSGAGLLFGRTRSGSDIVELWHVAEGGTPRRTGISYQLPPGAADRAGSPIPGTVDWSGSPPTGLP